MRWRRCSAEVEGVEASVVRVAGVAVAVAEAVAAVGAAEVVAVAEAEAEAVAWEKEKETALPSVVFLQEEEVEVWAYQESQYAVEAAEENSPYQAR